MKVCFIAQHGQEELDTFTERANQELERLGPKVRNIQMSTCLHERSIGGRVNIPTVIFALMVLYEESE